ncbi:MAG: hypothetical protein ACPG3U_09375 [Rhodothermales bacterium]
MKRTLIVAAAAAFLLVLFAKPLDFISHYSEHARHATHAVSTNPDVSPDRHVLIELNKASVDSGHVGIEAWVVLLVFLGVGTVVGLTMARRRNEQRNNRKRGLC